MCSVVVEFVVDHAEHLTLAERVALSAIRMLLVELTSQGIGACVQLHESRWVTLESTEGKNS